MKIFLILSIFSLSVAAQAESMDMSHPTFVSDKQCIDSVGRSSNISPAQQEIINKVVGSRSHRTEHALWHASRSGFDQNADSVAKAYGQDWINPDSLCPAPNKSDSKYNPAGEDFLFMHRGMVGAIRSALIAAKLPCIKGWSEIPDPNEWKIPDIELSNKDAKSEETLTQLKNWDDYFQKPEHLDWRRSITLSQMGFALEFTIHNNLHMRYATLRPALEFQSADGNDGANLPLNGNFPKDWNFDSTDYHWLADPYGAAVNPLFWKIHGYVDSLITRWLTDNGYDDIKEDCTGIASCYKWKGTWVGTDLHIDPPPPMKGLPPGGSIHQGGQQPPPNATDNNFKILRMKLAHLGVLKDKPPGVPGGAKAPPPVAMDPYSAAVANVCRGR